MTNIKVGDIIQAYHKGYWKVTRVERRFLTKDDLRFEAYKTCKVGDEYSPLIHYVQLMNSNGKKMKSSKEQVCDAAYCTVLTKEWIEEQRQKDLQRWANIESLI